jgi:tetratricopeptide (TPR) repeat protein
MDAALEKLARLEAEFPASEVIDMAYNLKGNVLQNQNKDEEAEQYYLKALELAERRENRIVAGEALNYLVAMLGEKPKKESDPNRMKEAIPHADKFWKEYPDSPYKAQVAVGQMHAMQSVGRGEEALDRLRDVIADLATQPGAVGMEEAIGSYTEAYLESHSPEELKEHYYNFPKIRATDKAARALLRIAIIGVYEDQLKQAKTDQEKIDAEAGIKVIFRDLKNDFDLKDLSNYILVRVGDFIRQTNSPQEALPYYNEALAREDKSYRFPALFGRAAVRAKGTAADKKEAVADFERVLKDSQDRDDKDRALFGLIEAQMDLGEHEKAKENARKYLDRENGYSTKRPEVSMILGEAYNKLGMIDDALSTFINTANSYPGALRISAPATKRAMEIFWARNKIAANGVPDRQGAYNLGRFYIDRTRRIVTGDDVKASDEEIAMWKEVERLVEQYVADPSVKSKEQLEEEAR